MLREGLLLGSVSVQTWIIQGNVAEHDELMVHWLNHVRRRFPVTGMRYFRPPLGPVLMRSWAVTLEGREALRCYLGFLREDEDSLRYRSRWLELMQHSSYSVSVQHELDLSGLDQPV